MNTLFRNAARQFADCFTTPPSPGQIVELASIGFPPMGSPSLRYCRMSLIHASTPGSETRFFNRGDAFDVAVIRLAFERAAQGERVTPEQALKAIDCEDMDFLNLLILPSPKLYELLDEILVEGGTPLHDAATIVAHQHVEALTDGAMSLVREKVALEDEINS